MKCYIAAPFFNEAQIGLVLDIENCLYEAGIEFYSPRIHSGSKNLSPEERRRREPWFSVLASNVREISACDIVIAVVDYLLPESQTATISYKPNFITTDYEFIREISTADNGVCVEIGLAYAIGRPCLIFCAEPPKRLNLMLSHTCEGMVIGFENLANISKKEPFLRGEDYAAFVQNHADILEEIMPIQHLYVYEDKCALINWDAVTEFAEEVE